MLIHGLCIAFAIKPMYCILNYYRRFNFTAIGNQYWKNFQLSHGRNEKEIQKHLERFDTEYFPITVEEHLELLRATGFKTVELFWYSYMQAGFYCIK